MVRREIRSNHSWTSLFQHTIANGNVIWEWNRVSLAELSKKITNPFWVEVLEAVSKISDNIDMDSGFLNRSGLWYSNVTRYKTSCIVACHNKGLRYISDLLNVQGQVQSFEQIKTVFGIPGSYLDYMGLIKSIPSEWRTKTFKNKAEYPIIHPQVEVMICKQRGAKYLNNILLQKKLEKVKNSWENSWETKFGQINWPKIYDTICKSSSVYYHMLSYKIITQIVVTNILLYRIGIRNSPFCSRCKNCRETIEHKFWYCKEVNNFWKTIEDFINRLDIFEGMVSLTRNNAILGSSVSMVMNQVIATGKSMITREMNLNINLFVN